jgi:hypothetical protein
MIGVDRAGQIHPRRLFLDCEWASVGGQIVACEPDAAKGERRKAVFSLALFGNMATFRRNALTWCAVELFSAAVCLASINKVKRQEHISQEEL